MSRQILLGSLLLSSVAFAGHRNNNGGGGMLCGSGANKKMILLDFWEAEKLKGMKLRSSNAPVLEQAMAALAGLRRAGWSNIFVEGMETELKHQLSVQEDSFISDDVTIVFPPDAQNRFLGRGCDPVGIALYDDENGRIDIDRLNFKQLSLTGQAGLYVHEVVYKFLRDSYQVETSEVARNITACLFSETPCAELDHRYGLAATGAAYRCTLPTWPQTPTAINDANPWGSARPEFEVFADPKGGGLSGSLNLWRFQLVKLGSEGMPVAATYFSSWLDGDAPNFRIPLSGQNRLRLHTVSSPQRWKNIGISYSYVIENSATGGLKINGHDLRCRKIR